MPYTTNDYVSAALEALRTARTHLYHAGQAPLRSTELVLALKLDISDRLEALIAELDARQNAGEFDA